MRSIKWYKSIAPRIIGVYMKYIRGGRKRVVLEAIPQDRWVRAGEIASKVGMSSIGVGSIISWHLMPSHVEMKEIDEPKPGTKVYKRRPCALEIKKPRD